MTLDPEFDVPTALQINGEKYLSGDEFPLLKHELRIKEFLKRNMKMPRTCSQKWVRKMEQYYRFQLKYIETIKAMAKKQKRKVGKNGH